ncbi:MAG: class I SAM-dependent methyltransferase [Opitutales bacterium]|nr:class I SAM-dependent methyltransferase [Opitutales bacterium]NRA26343.1 class I SAM-dependent methyltransferase [Opitutales bacterium]
MHIDLALSDWDNYALLDTGNREKLERFGEYILVRSEPKAWWKPSLPKKNWEAAHARFDEDTNKWLRKKGCPASWWISYRGVRFEVKLTGGSKHVGVFPEQAPHWDFIHQQIASGHVKSVLNLFGYTGAASLIAAKSGAQVTHCDASKPVIAWGRSNQEASGMGDLPVRWILDDALKFVQREVRRGRQYDAVLLDPPSFGRGPKNELWKVEQGIIELLETCRQVMGPSPKMMLLTMYNLEASSLMLHHLLARLFGQRKGSIEVGELVLKQSSDGLLLPLSLYGRWTADP